MVQALALLSTPWHGGAWWCRVVLNAASPAAQDPVRFFVKLSLNMNQAISYIWSDKDISDFRQSTLDALWRRGLVEGKPAGSGGDCYLQLTDLGHELA